MPSNRCLSLTLTDKERLVSELTRSDSWPWHQLELLVCLQCWQAGKEFRLHWHSFVRVQIYYIYQLSINRTNTPSSCKSLRAQWIVHWPPESGIVSSSPSIIKYLLLFFFISWSFLFVFLHFEVKQCTKIYWKYDNTGFAMEKKPNFLFFKMAYTPHKGKIRTHCVVIKLSIEGIMFYRDENDLAPYDK